MRQILPVATLRDVRRYAGRLVARHPRELAGVLVLHGAAAASGLVTPRLLGNLVAAVQHGTARWTVDKVALAIAGFVVVQAVLVRFAVYASARLGERVMAELREEFVDRVLAIPLSTVELPPNSSHSRPWNRRPSPAATRIVSRTVATAMSFSGTSARRTSVSGT